jgi:hypothetical protein
LPPKITKYRYDATDNPNGRGEFLMVFPEAGTQNNPRAATYADGDAWADRWDIDYPLVIDPEYTFEPTMVQEQAAWPCNFLIDTRTMTIVEIIAGSPEAAFWSKYDDVLAGTWQQ